MGFGPQDRGPHGSDPGHDSWRGSTLPNPVGLAAGFDKDAEAPDAMLAAGFSFVECGTVTPLPQAGNPRPRLFRLDADRAVINRMGFNNRGLEASAARLEGRPRVGIVGFNIGANKDSADRVGDYVLGLERLEGLCDYLTVNISSPNTPGLRGATVAPGAGGAVRPAGLRPRPGRAAAPRCSSRSRRTWRTRNWPPSSRRR